MADAIEDDQIAALRKLEAQQSLLRDSALASLLRTVSRQRSLLQLQSRRMCSKVAQTLQAKHSALQADRREKSAKLDKLLPSKNQPLKSPSQISRCRALLCVVGVMRMPRGRSMHS